MEFKSCYKRSVVYETWCELCKKGNNIQKEENRSIENAEDSPKVHSTNGVVIVDLVGENDNEETNVADSKRKFTDEKPEPPLYRYIGETSRSVFERGGEHKKDLKYRHTKSHMLRHIVEKHPGVDPDTVEFKIKVLSNHKSAFERQIREAVMIDHFAGPHLLNSKLEYNRCSIPKIIMKLGNEEPKEDPKLTTEKGTIEKIKMLFKGENKRQNIDCDTEVTEEEIVTKKRPKLEELEGGSKVNSGQNNECIGPIILTPKEGQIEAQKVLINDSKRLNNSSLAMDQKVTQNGQKSDSKRLIDSPLVKCDTSLIRSPPKTGEKVAKSDSKMVSIGPIVKGGDIAHMSDISGPNIDKKSFDKNDKMPSQNVKSVKSVKSEITPKTPLIREKIIVKRDSIRLLTSPKIKLKSDFVSPKGKRSVLKGDKKESKDKIHKIQSIKETNSSKSKVKDIINAFENNVKVEGDTPVNADKEKVKDAFEVMMGKSINNWGELSSRSPRQKSLKRIRKYQPSSSEKSTLLQEWLRKEKN